MRRYVPAIRAAWADSADPVDWWWREDVVWVLERPMMKATGGLLFLERNSESPWRSCMWNGECATDVGRCRELRLVVLRIGKSGVKAEAVIEHGYLNFRAKYYIQVRHTEHTTNAISLGNQRPTSLRSRPAAVEGPGSGQLLTASSTSSKKVTLLWMDVPPRTTRTPGELALTCATIFASSYVTPPTMKMMISWGLSRM